MCSLPTTASVTPVQHALHDMFMVSVVPQITFTAPAGPNPPLDPTSARIFKEDPDSIKFLADETVQQKLASALLLRDVKLSDYDVLYYVGGSVS